jgi:hypothetical protein
MSNLGLDRGRVCRVPPHGYALGTLVASRHRVGDLTYKVHLDGYNLVPYLTGQAAKSPRDSFFVVCSRRSVATETRLRGWACRTRTQKRRRKLSL